MDINRGNYQWKIFKGVETVWGICPWEGLFTGDTIWGNFTHEQLSTETLGGKNFHEKFFAEGGFPE